MKKFAVLIVIVFMMILAGCQQRNPSVDSVKSAGPGSGAQAAVVIQPQDSSQKEAVTTDKSSESTTETASQEAKAQESTTQAASVQNTSKPQAEPKKEPAAFTLVVSKNSGAEVLINKKITISGKKSALEYLRENASVIDEGGFVKGVNDLKTIPSMGLTAEQKKAGVLGVDWFLYQNDKKTRYGAADIYPQNGDVIRFDYKEWTYKDLAP